MIPDDSLLLSSGELAWRVMIAIRQSYAVQRMFGSAPPLPAANARVNKRKLDVLLRARSREKSRQLKNESDVFTPDRRTGVFAQRRDRTAV